MNQFAQLLSAEKQSAIVLNCRTIMALNKDGQMSIGSAISLIESFSGNGLIECVSCSYDKEIVVQAEAMRAKYLVCCYYPDVLHVIITNKYGQLLVTLDRKNLKDIARAESVLTSHSGNYKLYN